MLPILLEELPAQFHMNLGVYYNYTQNISAYLQLNNLTNSKQDVWIGYREVGFNGLFGLNYSF
jgi:outer membrane receptor protein involved in Fe transport